MNSEKKIERMDLVYMLSNCIRSAKTRGRWSGDRGGRYYLWLGLQYRELLERAFRTTYENELRGIYDEMTAYNLTLATGTLSPGPSLPDKFLQWEKEMLQCEANVDVAEIRLFVHWTRDRCSPGEDFLADGRWLVEFRRFTVKEKEYLRRAYFPREHMEVFTPGPCECGTTLFERTLHAEDAFRCGKCMKVWGKRELAWKRELAQSGSR